MFSFLGLDYLEIKIGVKRNTVYDFDFKVHGQLLYEVRISMFDHICLVEATRTISMMTISPLYSGILSWYLAKSIS